jgi:hypothetical protein
MSDTAKGLHIVEINPEDTDEDLTDEDEDATDMLLSLRGPGGMFYKDTDYHIKIDQAVNWIKTYYQRELSTLTIYWTDDTKDVFTS